MRRDPHEFTLRSWSRSGPVEEVQHWGLWDTSKRGEPVRWTSKKSGWTPIWKLSGGLGESVRLHFAVELSSPHTNKNQCLRLKKEKTLIQNFLQEFVIFFTSWSFVCTRGQLFSWIMPLINAWVYSCIDICYCTSLKENKKSVTSRYVLVELIIRCRRI